MKRFHWQLFALLFSVSIENFGFTVSTPFFFLLKSVSLNCDMSKMHVNHSRVPVDLEKNSTVWQRREQNSKTS